MLMKVLLVLVIATVAMAAPTKLLVGPVDVQEEWTKWKTQHNKSYESDEETKRFKIFEENLKKIIDHNEKFQAGEVTWTQGLNQFADLNQEEFSKTYLGLRKPEQGLTGLH